MPRKASGNFDQSKYIQEYMKENVTVKKVTFNKHTDADLIDWTAERAFSTYVKGLIRKDMKVSPKYYPPTRYSDTLYGCGACGHELPKGKPKSCPTCGQAIDWNKIT